MGASSSLSQLLTVFGFSMHPAVLMAISDFEINYFNDFDESKALYARENISAIATLFPQTHCRFVCIDFLLDLW